MGNQESDEGWAPRSLASWDHEAGQDDRAQGSVPHKDGHCLPAWVSPGMLVRNTSSWTSIQSCWTRAVGSRARIQILDKSLGDVTTFPLHRWHGGDQNKLCLSMLRCSPAPWSSCDSGKSQTMSKSQAKSLHGTTQTSANAKLHPSPWVDADVPAHLPFTRPG